MSTSRHAIGVFSVGVLWALAASCARDERIVQLRGTENAGANAGASGAGSSTQVEGLQPAAQLEVRPPTVDLGAVAVGFASRARLKIVNTGSSPLPVPALKWSDGSEGTYEVIQNQCLSEVPAGSSCDLRVQLVPSRVGTFAAALEVGSPGADSVNVPFTAEGLAAGNLILAPAVGSFEDFGGVYVGSVGESTFSILNPDAAASGPLSFRLNRPEFALLPAQAGECVPGVTELAGGAACNLRVAFTPSERGPLEATLTVATATAGSVSLNLSGDGLASGVLQASTSTLEFGGVVLGSSGFGSIRFQNQGDEPLTLGGARLEPGDVPEFSIQNSNCGAGTPLPGGAACVVGLEFRPTVQGEERAAELVLEVMGAEPQRVGLAGHGLEPGSLVVVASVPGEEDFGDVLLTQSVTREFEVTNPGTQPSGVLSLAASGSFELEAPRDAGDCVDGSTSLVNGERCTVRVTFRPTLRQLEPGALTVSSALAGASGLPLAGRGILPAQFEVGAEVNFGRVLTNATAERVITVKNAGDQALAAPVLEVTGSSSAQAAAFSFVSGCSAPLAFGEECSISVTFAPREALPHSANLKLSAEPGGTATVLLLGEALRPGSLVLAAAAGGSPDFGDVQIGTTLTRSFTLTNPGNVASGRLTLSTAGTQFLVNPGDCNQAPQGLVDGSSCTFSVAFTPDGPTAVVANVSVQSSGAGRAGLEIRGRGRSVASLMATGNRDLGRANIGRALAAANQFTWTINNQGDLASGTLRVTRGTVAEFQISNDTCSNAQIAGHASCQMVIGFVAAEPAGARSERIVVTDTASSRAVTLALTAVSVRVAAPGQSCINAECAQGLCTDGVCCDRACDHTCQQCSQSGVCADESSQQQCGNGSARCFGVDLCLLPAGQACGANSDCGGGLQCKQCLAGGRQCTAAATCCGGCPGSQTCVNGSCACTAQQIDCGGGLCIARNQGSLCCPSNPQCPANLPACTTDGRCVQCLTDAQCDPCSACNRATNTCAPRTRGTSGFCPGQQLCNGAGACFAPECGFTGAPACGDCRTCQDFQCRAVGENSICQQNGLCVAGTCRPGPGQACTQGGTPCANNLPCTNRICQAPTVGNGAACGVNATCDARLGLQCLSGTCACIAAQHFCGGGINSCSANNDITRCALTPTTCTDCTQANANAACGGSGCNNTCRGTTICSGTGGRPSCGSWDFETGTQGWVAGRGAVGMTGIAVSNLHATSGRNSLAVSFQPTFLDATMQNVQDGSYRIQVSLCGGSVIDLRGRTIQARIFLDADPNSTLPVAGAVTYATPGAVSVGVNSVPLTAGGSTIVTTEPIPAGTGLNSATNIGFEVNVKFGSSPTGGTVFFDDIQVL